MRAARGQAGAPTPLGEEIQIEQDRIGAWRAGIPAGVSGFGGGTHGGYLAALALRTLEVRFGGRQLPPRSLGLQLLEPTGPGTVELAVGVDRVGAASAAASLRASQDGLLTYTAHGTFGADRASPSHLAAGMPSVPLPEDCRPLPERPEGIGLLVEHRPAAGPLPLSGGERAEILVWMRLGEERPLDLAGAALLADAGPPALFGRLSEFVSMPSIEISIHFCDLAALVEGPWLLGVFRTVRAGAGYAIEDGELWTRSGRLVLASRQLRRVLARSS